MNKSGPFIFNGRAYYSGTIVKVKEECKQYFKFNSTLQFTGYIVDEKVYCFSSLHNKWDVYKLSSRQVAECFETILKENIMSHDNKRVDPNYIDSMASAWILYIFIMFFALFFKGAGNIVTTWCLATFIFFTWRHRKIKGG